LRVFEFVGEQNNRIEIVSGVIRMAYRTRSNTLKLQRLIEVLRERGSDLAASLEATASDFLDDVKPKSKPAANLVNTTWGPCYGCNFELV
jgi:hypothetical protein